MVNKRTLYALGVLTVIAATLSFVLLEPRPTRISVTARAGDDTVVVNQTHPTRLTAAVLDQYGRRRRADTTLHYRRIAGDSMSLASGGEVRCDSRGDAVVRVTFGSLIKQFVLRCRPVASIEAPSWLDLVAGDSARDLSFVAHGPDGRSVTELRGAVVVENGAIAGAEGTTLRPKRAGSTTAIVAVGDAHAAIPVMVYQPVKSFVDNPRKIGLMAVHVSLARGDTIELPVPKAAFWVTYFSNDRAAAPPTIELRGSGSCAAGNGIRVRRIEEDEYAKYCLTGDGARLMIAHGASGAPMVNGVIAIRLMQ